MWQGSAAEYRYEHQNEVVCLQCGAKRKDLCTGPGGVVDAHYSRSAYEDLLREYDRKQDEAYQVSIKIEEYRQKVRDMLAGQHKGEDR